MVYIDNRLISLNSNYGTQLNGSKLSNLIFNFKGLLKRDEDIVMATISVINAQIPCSFFIINSTNNIIIIRNSSNIPNSYTIPIGNYNANTLITQIIATVNAVTGVGILISSITISPTTGILKFSFSTSCTLLASSSMASVLGLSTTNLTGSTFTLPFPLNLLGAKRLSIKSTYLSTNAYHSFNLGSTTTLTTIPIDQPSFNMISFLNQSDLNTYVLTCSTIDTIDIQIFDEFNNYFDFNNVDWSISLNLGITRKDRPIILSDLITNLKEHNNKKQPESVDSIIEEITKPKELSQNEKDLELLQKKV